jgi:hypothetical protein
MRVFAGDTADFQALLGRLSKLSLADHYNPFQHFEWPASLPSDQYWMSPSLLTVFDTEIAQQLTEEELQSLSRWESLHFYSLNIHGIRELLTEVVRRIHSPGFSLPSEFFHHFIREENDHMWFFAEFCNRYGKIYPDKSLKLGGKPDAAVEDFLVFAKIQLFEEIVDFFNSAMANDEALPPFIRELNRVHHRDESRHIAFGREIVAQLFRVMQGNASAQAVEDARTYVRRYLEVSIQSLYNPAVYRDAQLPFDAYATRTRLLGDERRRARHRDILKRPLSFLIKNEILPADTVIA